MLLTRRLTDPVFGVIRYKGNGVWSGEWSLNLAGPGSVHVDVFADEVGPSPNQRDRFMELQAFFPTLRTEMALPLFNEYQVVRSDAAAEYSSSPLGGGEKLDADYPPVSRPEDIWKVAILRRVEVCRDSTVDFSFDHEVLWADDHQLNVLVKDWRVLEVAREG